MNEKRDIFFHKNEKNLTSIAASIREACDGLIFISETDSQVTLFEGGSATDPQKAVTDDAGPEAASLLSEVTLDSFFGPLTTVQDWFGEKERTMAKKFLEMRKLLEEDLIDLKVFRLGRTRIDIYVVGVTPDGRVLGIRTKAVET